jgi:hypothetical protein
MKSDTTLSLEIETCECRIRQLEAKLVDLKTRLYFLQKEKSKQKIIL